MSASLATRDLAFSYGGADDHPVFAGVDFSVHPGQVFGLLGPNGTGKSTLLRCLSGLLEPSCGRVELHGKDIADLGAQERARLLGYVPQVQTSTFPFLIRDIVLMGRAPHLSTLATPKDEDLAIAMDALARVGAEHLALKPCTGVSGGEWQLTLVARALAQQPRVLLLDEPTSHLDIANQMRILDVVRDLAASGLAVVMATHFPDHAFLAAHQVAILKQGGFMAQGEPQDTLTEDVLEQAYGRPVRVVRVEHPGSDGENLDRTVCLPL